MKKILINIVLIPFTWAIGYVNLQNMNLMVYDMKESDINAWNIKVLNDGRFGHNAKLGEAGGYWPQPYKNFYIFGAGIWIGVYDKNSLQTLVTCGYIPEAGASEMVPTIHDYWKEGYGNPKDRIYKSTEDNWEEVPWDRFHIKPTPKVLSHQDMFCVFCDLDPREHDTRPIGVDVYLWIYAWKDELYKDIVYLRYIIKNVSHLILDSMYVGIVVDSDIGYYRDDRTGLILKKRFDQYVLNVGFALDYDGKEGPSKFWEQGTPGVVGCHLIRSPYALKDGIDNDNDGLTDQEELDSLLLKEKYPPYGDKDRDAIPDWKDPSEIEQFGLTAFKQFSIDSDPPTDSARYMEMAGYDWATGAYNPYDSIDLVPGDKIFLLSTGPFSLSPNDSVIIVTAIIGAPYWVNGKEDISYLLKKSYYAEKLWNEKEKILLEPGVIGVKDLENKDTEHFPINLFVKHTLSLPFEKSEIILYSTNGAKLIEKSLEKNQKISLESLPPGIYFLNVKTQNKNYRLKLIKYQ